MKRNRKTNTKAWEWRESKTVKNQDELRAGDRILATLRWQGWLSTLAVARSPEGQWTFERPKLLSRDVEVRVAGSEAASSSATASSSAAPIAVYWEKWTGDGTLEFADGRALDWAPTDFWQTRWAFFDKADKPLVCFEDTSRLFESTARVTYWPSELSASDCALLTLLGRYLMVLRQRDTAAVVAAIVPVIAS